MSNEQSISNMDVVALLVSGTTVNNHQEGDRMDIDALRKQAADKHQILRITFYPDIDSVENFDTLYDVDNLAFVEFLDVPVSAPSKAKP